MLEMASLGAGVMHSRSIEFAKKYRVPLRVRPAYSDGAGSLIAPTSEDNSPVVTGVALVKDEARVTLYDIPDRPGVVSLIFAKMAERKIPIDMVVQDVGQGGLAEISFTVPKGDLAEALTAAEEAVKELGSGSVHHGTNLSKVSVVGRGMRTHTGVAAHMFQAVAESGASIDMITTSEIKISVLVDRDRGVDVVKVVHNAFSLHDPSSQPPAVGFVPRESGAKMSAASREELERDVVSRLAAMEDIVVSEVELDKTQSRVTIRNLPDVPGVAAQVFTAVAEGQIMVDMIVQNVGREGQAHLSFTVLRDDLEQCLLLVREVMEEWPGAELSFDREIAKLTVMGIGLRSHTGVGDKMFKALAAAKVNVQLINTSEILISAVVAPGDGEAAHKALLGTFGLKG
jgi:aspartate kinase